MTHVRYPQTAAAIKSARLRKGYSQEKAARLVGTSRFHWIRWEQGLHRPLEFAPRIADVLGCPVESLTTEDDEAEAASMAPLAAENLIDTLAEALEALREKKAELADLLKVEL